MTVEHNRLKRTWIAAVCVGSALGAGGAPALEWNQTPTVSVASGADSNIRMSVENERQVTSGRVDVRTNVTGAGERMQLAISPRLYAIDYNDDFVADRRDGYLDTSLAVGNERQRWTLTAGYASEGTLETALEESGFTRVDVDLDRTSYGVGWRRQTSERGSVSFSLASRSVRYDEVAIAPFRDYDYPSASFGYARALGERIGVELALRGSRFDAVDPLRETESAGLGVALAGRWSESLEYRLGAGRYRARYPGLGGSETTSTALDASLAKRWERWNVTAALSSGLEPSSYGVLYDRDSVSFGVNHRFTEAIDAGLRLTAAHIESDQPLLWNEDRRYAYAQLSLNWRFAERLSLSLNLGTRAQEYIDQPQARSTYAQIGLTYRGRGS